MFYNICLTLMTMEKKNMVIKDFLITQYEFKAELNYGILITLQKLINHS